MPNPLKRTISWCTLIRIKRYDNRQRFCHQKMEQDPNEMMDPNLLNPLSKQGYGKEDPPAYNVNKNKKQDKTDKKKAAEEAYKNRSMGEQTKQAALQMGVLVITIVEHAQFRGNHPANTDDYTSI